LDIAHLFRSCLFQYVYIILSFGQDVNHLFER